MDRIKLIVSTLEEKKAENIKVLDVSKQTNIADYFIIATANSSVHAKALAENIEKKLKENNILIDHVEGLSSNPVWVLIDMLDIIIHIFTKETREYYGLDWLWSDAKEVRV